MNKTVSLNGIKVLLTRSAEQSQDALNQLREAGAEVYSFPVIDILPPESWAEFDAIVLEKRFDIIIFASVNAVGMFAERVKILNIELNYSDYLIVTSGSKTADECKKHNIPVNVIPEKFSGAGIIEALARRGVKDRTIFIPRSALAKNDLPEGLKKEGAFIKTAEVYNVGIPPAETITKNLAIIKDIRPDLIIFTSPSTFNNFLRIKNVNNPVEYFANFTVAVIGSTTKAAVKGKGVSVQIIPKEQNMNGLIQAIKDYYSETNRI